MWGELITLQRAIRRPMRRWWRRVGGWLLAVEMFFLMAEGLCQMLYLMAGRPAWPSVHCPPLIHNFLQNHYWSLPELAALCSALMVGLALLWGLLAAQSVLINAEKLYTDMAAPRLELRTRLQFALAFAHTWPVLLVVVLVGSGLWHQILTWLTLAMLNQPAGNPQRALQLSSVTEFLTMPVLLVWLLALLVIKRRLGWPLAWCLAYSLPLAYAKVPDLVGSLSNNYGLAHSLRFAELVELELGLGWLLGGLLVVGLLRMVQTGHNRLALGLMCVVCVSTFLYAVGDVLPGASQPRFNYDPAITPSSNLSIGLDLVRSAGDFTLRPLAAVDYSGFAEMPDRSSYELSLAFPVPLVFTVDKDPAGGARLLNLAYIALHFSLVWLLLGWYPRRYAPNGLSTDFSVH